MQKLLKQHQISFANAIAGIVWAFTTQPNFRVHATCSVLALFLCWYLGVTAVETSLIVFAIVLGLAGEMINTALESMTDLITKEWKQEAKIAKDVAAGMMLLIAVGAVLVALYIFIPYITELLGYY